MSQQFVFEGEEATLVFPSLINQQSTSTTPGVDPYLKVETITQNCVLAVLRGDLRADVSVREMQLISISDQYIRREYLFARHAVSDYYKLLTFDHEGLVRWIDDIVGHIGTSSEVTESMYFWFATLGLPIATTWKHYEGLIIKQQNKLRNLLWKKAPVEIPKPLSMRSIPIELQKIADEGNSMFHRNTDVRIHADILLGQLTIYWMSKGIYREYRVHT